MAFQIANFVSGRMDNVVFYERMGTYIARSVPAVVKQSAATKIRSRNFGVAAAAGKALRELLLPVLPFPKDRRMQIRFSGAIARWIGLDNPASLPAASEFSLINGFRFNDATAVAERWKIPFTVTQPSMQSIALQIPAFIPTTLIPAPANTVLVECTFTVAGCKLTGGTALAAVTEKLFIPYNSSTVDAQVIPFPVNILPGSLVITAARLQYRLANGEYNGSPAFQPASVINARYVAG